MFPKTSISCGFVGAATQLRCGALASMRTVAWSTRAILLPLPCLKPNPRAGHHARQRPFPLQLFHPKSSPHIPHQKLQTLGRARNLPPRLEFLLTTLSSGPCCVQQPLDASTSQWWSNLSRFLPYGGLESLTSSRSLGARSLASWPFGFCSRTPAFLAFASLGGSQKKRWGVLCNIPNLSRETLLVSVSVVFSVTRFILRVACFGFSFCC